MATLYDIDNAILNCIDQETGEIIDAEQLEALQMERDQKIESVALWIKNLAADAEAYKREKEVFAEKETIAKNKIERLKNWLAYATDGAKFQTAKVQISYRKSEAVEIQDEAALVAILQATSRDDLLTYKAPVPNKTAIKAAIKSGTTIDGATIIEKQNIQIK